MNQQINLYLPMFRRQEKIFSAMTMAQTSLLFLIVLTTIYFYGEYKIKPLESQLQHVNRDVATLQAQVNSYQKQIPEQARSKLLENEIARLEKELKQREEIQAILARQELGDTRGFSSYLEAIARQHVEGMWLTRVAIKNGGNALTLEGKTLSPVLVPRYIQRLGKENILSGITFNVMELQRPSANERQVAAGRSELDFNISTD
jgi:Tfp pilus assembly protein PilN